MNELAHSAFGSSNYSDHRAHNAIPLIQHTHTHKYGFFLFSLTVNPNIWNGRI